MAFAIAVFCIGFIVVSTARGDVYTQQHPWIKKWTKKDHSLSKSIEAASWTFKISAGWLWACNEAEGGNVSRRKLAVSIRHSEGKGWNVTGHSAAFGPWQYMLGARPPSGPHEWGTFGSYVHAAFRDAKARGVAIPYRFKRPDSYVGQAITTAYMFKHGLSWHWVGAGC